MVLGSCADFGNRPSKASDFEGAGGPETKQKIYEDANPGNDDVGSNGEFVHPGVLVDGLW